MKIIVDENIEFGEAFNKFGDVERSHGRKITNEMLKDCEALIVRSITKVNKDLLEGTPVKFVGTATIGTDHLDKEYLDSKGIKYASAPGCNSYAVVEYVFTSLFRIAKEYNFDLTEKSIGIIGYGNIGTKIKKYAEALGMETLVNDPPLERKRRNEDQIFSSLEETLTADIITCHVPLNKEGIDKTVHLIGEKKIDSLKPGTILINSCRGPVVNNTALINRINSKNDIIAVLDVWENEPRLNTDLLDKAFITTPHIAGYSLEGKVNGTTMIYEKLCKFLGEKPNYKPAMPKVENDEIVLQPGNDINEIMVDLTSQIYPIDRDTSELKSLSGLPEDELAMKFDALRKNYSLRREFSNYRITSDTAPDKIKEKLKIFRFNLI